MLIKLLKILTLNSILLLFCLILYNIVILFSYLHNNNIFFTNFFFRY